MKDKQSEAKMYISRWPGSFHTVLSVVAVANTVRYATIAHFLAVGKAAVTDLISTMPIPGTPSAPVGS